MADFKYYKGHNWQDQNGDESMPTGAPSISADNLREMDDAIAGALPMEGGEMKGDLLLKGFPKEARSAVPKEYADTNIMYIYETYSQTGTYTKKIEGFDSNKYLPLVFLWTEAINVSNHFTIAKYDEEVTYYAYSSKSSYITIGSDGNITIEVNYSKINCPLIVLFLPAKKI